jgi:signal peptidase
MPMAVLSGSMEPAYHKGSLILVDTGVGPENVKQGDIITYRADSKVIITHRVLEADHIERFFITKGDALPEQDNSPITYDMYVGVSGGEIPFFGYILLNAAAPRRLASIIAIISGVLVLLLVIPALLKQGNVMAEIGR